MWTNEGQDLKGDHKYAFRNIFQFKFAILT
jgi:hypothetical protein